ncbi:MAG: DMT family transporter [Rhizobiaceae bacterium]|nr:DMT family transporter [Rhizobiaceae bacterium]MCV0404901.1 DMT family transporter [Rhizobiaceae bacterium]
MSESPTAGGATPLAAILCVFGAFFLFSCTDAGAKTLVLAGMHPAFVSWMRFVVHAILAVLLMRAWWKPGRFLSRRWWAHLLRGAMLFSSGLMAFSALRSLQLVEFISIIFMAPLVITVLASVLLGEHVEWRRWMAVLVGLAGVMVITRPGMGVFQIGHLLAIGAMLAYCVFVILTRFLSATESQETLLLLPALVAVVGMLPAIPAIASLPVGPLHWVILLSLGIFGASGHWLLIRAYRIASASALAPYAYLQMLWTLFFGYMLFGDVPDRWTVVGASIIVASGLYLMHRDRRSHLVASGVAGPLR